MAFGKGLYVPAAFQSCTFNELVIGMANFGYEDVRYAERLVILCS